MTGAGCLYGQALYSLARDEGLAESVLNEITVLEESFSREPDFLRLLNSPNVPREERCTILDECFRGSVHSYVLNVLKLLMEKGHILQFRQCAETYRDLFYEENQILPVQATTAVALTAGQCDRLTEKLSGLTGKNVRLTNRVDPAVLGGVCLDYDGRRLNDTVAHRLDEIKGLLANTVL